MNYSAHGEAGLPRRYTPSCSRGPVGLFPFANAAIGIDVGGLLQRVHEAGDGAVQIFVVAAELFDFVDGVKDGGVMFAAELAADLGK